MPNTPAYYPRTKKPRKRKEDEYFKHVAERQGQNDRIRGAKKARRLISEAKLPSERGAVVSPTQKTSTFVPDAKGVLPQSDFAEAQARPEMTPFRAAQLKGQAAKRAAADADGAGVGDIQKRRQAEAIKNTKIELGDRERFHSERKAGEHGYPNTLDGVREWKRDKLDKQKKLDSYKKRTSDPETMKRVKDLQDRIGKLEPGKQAEAWKNVRESGLFGDVIDLAQPAGDIDSIIGKPQTEAEIADAKFKRKLEENEAIYKQAETLNAASKKKTRKQRTADAAEWFASPFSVRIGVEIPDGMDEGQILAGMSQPERDAYIRGKKLDKLVQDNKIDPYLAMKEFEKVQKVLAAAKIKSLERSQEVADAKAKQIEFDKREVAKAAKAAADIKRKAAEDKAERERKAAALIEQRDYDRKIAEAKQKYEREKDEAKQRYDEKQASIGRKVKTIEGKISSAEKRIGQKAIDLSDKDPEVRNAARKDTKELEAKIDGYEKDIENLYKKDDEDSAAEAKATADEADAPAKEAVPAPDVVEPIVEPPAPADRKGIIEASGYNIGDIGSWDEGTVIDADKMKFLMAYFFNNEDEVEALITSRKWK